MPLYRQLIGDTRRPSAPSARSRRATGRSWSRALSAAGASAVQFPRLRPVPALLGRSPGADPDRSPRRHGPGLDRGGTCRPIALLQERLAGVPTSICRGCPGSPVGRSVMPLTIRSLCGDLPTRRPTIASCLTCSFAFYDRMVIFDHIRRPSRWSPTPTSTRTTPERLRARVRPRGPAGGAPSSGSGRPPVDGHRAAGQATIRIVELRAGGVQRGGPGLQGIHQGRRHLPGGPRPALPDRDASPAVRYLPHPAWWKPRTRSCSISRWGRPA